MALSKTRKCYDLEGFKLTLQTTAPPRTDHSRLPRLAGDWGDLLSQAIEKLNDLRGKSGFLIRVIRGLK